MVNFLSWLVVRHCRAVLIVSAVVLIGLVVLSVGAFPLLKNGGFTDPLAPSSRAEATLDREFGGIPNLVFLVTARPGQELDGPGVAAAARAAVLDPVSADPSISSVASYWDTPVPQLRAADGNSGLVAVHVDGDEEQADASATALIQRVRDATVGHPEVSVRAGGELGVGEDLGEQVVVDLAVAEAVAVPVTLVLLLFAFGSVVAALLPLLVGAFAVAGALAVLHVVGSVTDVSVYAINLTTGLGLGLAIDYALLIVNRFREELRCGADPPLAVIVTVQTAGRTVMVSSAIVAVGLLAMLAFPLYFLRSFAYSGTGVVLIAMLAAVVTLPAGLALLAERVNAGRLRRDRPVRAASERSPFWTRLASAVMRHPVLAAVPVVVTMVLLAGPALHIAFGTPDDRVLPLSSDSRQVGEQLRTNFGGSSEAESSVLLSGNPQVEEVRAYAGALSRIAGVTGVQSAEGRWVDGQQADPPGDRAQFARPGVQLLTLTGPIDGASQAAQDVVDAARAVPTPPTTTAVVGGAPATLVDAKQAIVDGLPTAGGWIAGSTVVLLFLFTGSVLVPVKALLLNVLSLGAVFGTVVWIFQDGNLSAELGFTPGPIDTSMPVLLFCIAFGLSMDYEVFLLARIKEEYDRTGDNTSAVVSGLSRTGRIVTTSAALLAVTFFAFGLSQVSFLKLFGIGTAVAIVLDATLVRAVLVPALMRLAGRANWWAPPLLRRLHDRIGISESADPGPAAASVDEPPVPVRAPVPAPPPPAPRHRPYIEPDTVVLPLVPARSARAYR